MKHILISATLALTATAVAAQETTIRVHYAIPTIWSDAQAQIAEAFMAENPDIRVVIDGPAENYEQGVQRLLREAVAGTLPDVAYVGLNLWRVLQARDLAQPLEPFMGDREAFEAEGFRAAVRLGEFDGTVYALGASASTLVMYVNPDLVEQAGARWMISPPTGTGSSNWPPRSMRSRRRSTGSGCSAMTGASSHCWARMAGGR